MGGRYLFAATEEVVEKRFSCTDELEEFVKALKAPWYAAERVAMMNDDPKDQEVDLWRFSSNPRTLINAVWPDIQIVRSDSREWDEWIKMDMAQGLGKPYETFSQWYPGEWRVKNFWYDDYGTWGDWHPDFTVSLEQATEDFYKVVVRELFEEGFCPKEYFFYSSNRPNDIQSTIEGWREEKG